MYFKNEYIEGAMIMVNVQHVKLREVDADVSPAYTRSMVKRFRD